MNYQMERNITEIKNEYTTFLINLITPFIYEGIRSVYAFSLNAHKEFLERGKNDPTVKSPGILKIFQLSLKEIPTLNNNSIELETNRIKSGSKCADWFDDLVKAVIKSNIVLLTFTNPKKIPDIVKEKYHERIDVKDYIHKCYIESARVIYNNPELFWHEYSPLEIKRNQREACELIKQAIKEAIRKMLPIKLILKDYLQNDYIIEEENEFGNKVSETQYINMKTMVDRDLTGKIDVSNKGTVLEYEDESDDEDYNKYEESKEELSEENLLDEPKNENQIQEENMDPEAIIDDDMTDQFLDDLKDKLKNVEENLDNKNNLEEKKETTITKTLPVNQQAEASIPEPSQNTINTKNNNVVEKGVIPKAELDDEIKELLKKSTTITQLEKPKKKLNKKEEQLMKEIEEQIKPKAVGPDRKIFFEQYMK